MNRHQIDSQQNSAIDLDRNSRQVEHWLKKFRDRGQITQIEKGKQ